MPTSYMQAVSAIMGEVVAAQPASILDLGVGFGKYGVLCRETLDIAQERYARCTWQVRIDGVEGWPGYRNPIHEHAYHAVWYGLIERILPDLGVYDVVLMVDVVEHWPKEEGLAVLREAIRHTRKALIVSTPVYPAEMQPYLGNHLDTHRSVWTPDDFSSWPYRHHLVQVGDGGAQLFVIEGGVGA